MEKSLFKGIAALSLITVLASGCTQETVESRGDKQIKFNPVVGKQTRASEFIYWTAGDQINVSAFGVGGTALYRVFTLTYGGGGFNDWSYGTPIAHPGVPLVFYSFYPEDNVSAILLDGTSGTFDYTILDEDNQEDLIAASESTPDHLVGLQFKHLLSQVNFAIWGIEGVKVGVTNIQISGVADTGTYTFGQGWSNRSGDATYSYTAAGAEITDGTSEILYLGNMGGGNPADNANDNAFMLLPQEFSTPGVSFINFDYTIYDTDDVELRTGSASIDLSELGTTTWDTGKRYLYMMDFSGDEISFFITVNSWEDDGIIDVQP